MSDGLGESWEEGKQLGCPDVWDSSWQSEQSIRARLCGHLCPPSLGRLGSGGPSFLPPFPACLHLPTCLASSPHPPRILHALSLCPRGAQSSPSGRTQRLRLSARPRQALAAGAARATVAGAGSASAICAVLSHAPQCRRFGPRQRQEPLVTRVPGAGACEGSGGGPEGRELMPEPEGLFWPPWPTSWCRGCSNCRRS